MSTDFQRLQQILAEAAAKSSPAERAAYVAEACGSDAELRQAVERLLKAHELAGDFLEQPAIQPEGESTGEASGRVISPSKLLELEQEMACVLGISRVGSVIGRYKLLQQIGEGGLGRVFLAEQQEPVRRTVALKIIKAGMDTREVIARFEAERQALALMDHPNIARVLDGGATETGRPYFVMELVKGIPITEYCDQNELTTADRLQLFMKVCHAVQHAHQKGIIHRDLKPSNILVTVIDGEAVPKVIDFGIAKALGQKLTEKTLFTRFQQFIGTPAYMSPEQAELSGVDVDTRSDIYSLGVLLYELLTGETPFDKETLHKAALDEVRRLIRETEPPKPSTRLRTLGEKLTEVARHRHSEPSALTRLVHGDLDWIVMKCLEKNRARRYGATSALVEDIQHHLQHEPVVACPPSAAYRFQKFARRHRTALAAGAVITVALVAAAAVSMWQAVRATRAEREQSRLRQQAETARNNEAKLRVRAEADEKKAETEAARSAQVAQFLKDMLQGVGPAVALGRDTTMLREILDQTAQRLSKDLKDQPEVEADLRETLGVVYRDLSEYAHAEAMLREALALQKKLHGNEHPAVASSLHNLAEVFRLQGKYPEAEAGFREALALRRKLYGHEHPTVAASLQGLGEVLRREGKYAEAEAALREALAMRQKLFGNDNLEVARSLTGLGILLRSEGKLTEAEQVLREALALQKKLHGNDHPEVAYTLYNLLGALRRMPGKTAEAETGLRELATMQKRLLGDHRETGQTLYALGLTLNDEGKLTEAEQVLREGLAMQKKVLGDHIDVSGSLRAVADVLAKQGKLAEAESLDREALALARKLYGNEHLAVAQVLLNLGLVLRDQGRLAEAETLFSQSLAMRRKLLGDEHLDVAWSLDDLAVVLRDQGRLAEAEPLFRQVLAMRRKLLGNEHSDVAQALAELAWVLAVQGKLAEAEQSCREALDLQRKLPGNNNQGIADSLSQLGRVLVAQGKLAESEPLYREAAERWRKEAESGNTAVFNALAWLLATCVHPELRDGASAVRFAEEAVAASNRKDAYVLDTLAAAYAEAGQFAKAVSAQQEAIALLPDGKMKEDLTVRLKLYQSNSPYRERGYDYY